VAGNWIAVGASKDPDTNHGAVYLFTKTASSSWTQMTRLLADDGAAGDKFGISLSISKDASAIVVGSAFHYNIDSIESGAAYLIQATNSTTTTTVEWSQVGKFMVAERDSNDKLGASVAIENNIVVVGAPGDDDDTGAVYVLDTEFPSSSQPPMETMPTTPTAKPVAVPNPQPTPNPTLEVTNPPTTLAPNDSDTSPPTASVSSTLGPTNLPTTMAPTLNTASSPPPMTNLPTSGTGFTAGAIVKISAMIGVFLVMQVA
jgi:hypothetical protein